MPFDIQNAPDGVIISGSGAALNAVPIGPFDTTKYMNYVVQILGTFGATVVFEGSNDEINPTNWFSIMSSNVASGLLAVSTTAVGAWYIPGVAKWFRVRLSAYSSGTVICNVLFSVDQLPSIQNSSQTVSGTVTSLTGVKTSGGATAVKILSAATTNATLVKASAGTIHSILLTNNTASAKFLKIFAKSTAPVPGTDVPVSTYSIPPNGVLSWDSSVGRAVATGIGYAITGAVADLDTTAVAVGDVVGHITYA